MSDEHDLKCQFDPRDASRDDQLLRAANELLERYPQASVLDKLEQQCSQENESASLIDRIAVKLARSKMMVRNIRRPLRISLVFAVYKEHARMLRPNQHPQGEDCLARKIGQLRWLFDDIDAVTWNMCIVDDGCPEESGTVAQQILNVRFPEAPVRVLFLKDAINNGLPIARPMKSTSDSQKGGSILYGMWTVAQEQHERHIVVFTDADLSVHLGQIGLLLDGILRKQKYVAIGSRREPTSVVVKKGLRDARGRLFIYLWKGLIRPLSYMTDTQCGFKAFTVEALFDLFENLSEKRFAFDIELLLLTELRRQDSICKVPIAWIDSESASTTTDLQPYLPMLRSVAAMYRKHLPANSEADRWADMIESMTEAEWAYLSENVPEAIAAGDPLGFDTDRPLTVDQLLAAVRR